MTNLPNGWQTKKVGELADTQLGKMLNKGKQTGKYTRPYLRSLNVQWGNVDTSELNEMDITPDEQDKFLVKKGDLLVCEGGESGRVAIWEHSDPIGFQNALHRVRAKKEITNKYLYYYFEWLVKNKLIEHLFNGVTIKHFPQENLRSVEINYPPLPEQHKIVEILEDHLSRLDAALADVKQAKIKAAQFRRSLLQAAFTGNLGSDGTRLMTNLPAGWQSETLEKLLSETIGGIWGEESGTSEIDVSVVRVTELKSHGRIDPSTAVTRSITQKQLASRELQEGDLLLEKSGGGPNSPVGRVGYFHQESTRTVCSNFMQLMRPNAEIVLPKYLFYFLDGFHSNGGTIPMQTATTNIRNIKMPQFMAISVPFPPLPEQQKIVELLEDHLSRLDASVALADAMEKQSAGLRRSLLQAAFTGQLTKEVASV